MLTQRSGRRSLWVAVALSMFTVAWGGNQFTPMLVFYREQGFFSALFIDLMLVSYAVGVAVGLLLAGPLSDRYGRRTLMLPTPVLAAISSVLIAVGEESGVWMTLGRILAGVAVGIAMTAGGSWIKELSDPRFDPTAKPSSGAKRASMSLTAGFALGPAVAGVLAQWAPWPGQLPYLLHIVLSLVLLPLLLVAPETRQAAHLNVKGSVWADLKVPSARHPRFLFVVALLGPWVFGAAFTAYAVLAGQLQAHVEFPVASAALIALVTLGSGFIIQQFGPQIAGPGKLRGPVIAITVTLIGMAAAAVVVTQHSLASTLFASVFLGLSYGLCMYVGLAESQKLATSRDLAGLSGYFYCLTYLGMVFPALLTRGSEWFSYPQMLGVGAIVAALMLMVLSRTARRC